MDRWIGRVAVVTGAASGIGAAVSYQLVDAGVTVVGLDINDDKILEEIERARNASHCRGRLHSDTVTTPGRIHSVKCDVSKEEDILKVFQWIQENTKGVHILVNCAGLTGQTKLTETNTQEWRRLLEVNVLGLSICTREAVKQMKKNGVNDGHIIHIGSIAGHKDPTLPGLQMYCASKHAVRVLTEGLRRELVALQSKIRITEVSPGLVLTRIHDNIDVNQKVLYKNPYLFPEDIADCVLFALSRPPHIQIHNIKIKPVGEEA